MHLIMLYAACCQNSLKLVTQRCVGRAAQQLLQQKIKHMIIASIRTILKEFNCNIPHCRLQQIAQLVPVIERWSGGYV